ncbi:MAG: hypothetical protein JRJ03_20020 [Deltaproteobacteria bacterium]|nr:hypothetical protein [Deltaproteobacteria bacterium]
MIPAEGQEKVDEFPGNEPGGPGDEESAPGRADDLDRDESQAEKSRKKPYIFIAAGLFALSLVSYLALRQIGPIHKKDMPLKDGHIKIQKQDMVTFDPFIIPFEGNSSFAYLYLSISFELPNKELREEVAGKREWLRGIIYDRLRRHLMRAKNLPSPEDLKPFIKENLREILAPQKLKEVYIIDFLAV